MVRRVLNDHNNILKYFGGDGSEVKYVDPVRILTSLVANLNSKDPKLYQPMIDLVNLLLR